MVNRSKERWSLLLELGCFIQHSLWYQDVGIMGTALVLKRMSWGGILGNGERGAQRPDCYDFVQGYSWGEQPGSQVLLWEGRAALFLESWCPLKPCPGFVKQSVLRARWEHSEVGVKKPSSGIVLTFQGQHHSLNFIKVETNARFQMSSPENPPIRGQEIWLPVAVMSPAVWCQAGRRAIPLATRGALEALPSSQP